MKNLIVSQPLFGGSHASRFKAAKATAYTLALADPEPVPSSTFAMPKATR